LQSAGFQTTSGKIQTYPSIFKQIISIHYEEFPLLNKPLSAKTVE